LIFAIISSRAEHSRGRFSGLPKRPDNRTARFRGQAGATSPPHKIAPVGRWIRRSRFHADEGKSLKLRN
jgi:hypothetical protein